VESYVPAAFTAPQSSARRARKLIGMLSGIYARNHSPVGLESPTYFSRNFSDGFSTVTIVFGGMLFVSDTLAPIAEPAPITVSPPSTVALA